jgi:hypothetical protein
MIDIFIDVIPSKAQLLGALTTLAKDNDIELVTDISVSIGSHSVICEVKSVTGTYRTRLSIYSKANVQAKDIINRIILFCNELECKGLISDDIIKPNHPNSFLIIEKGNYTQQYLTEDQMKGLEEIGEYPL